MPIKDINVLLKLIFKNFADTTKSDQFYAARTNEARTIEFAHLAELFVTD